MRGSNWGARKLCALLTGALIGFIVAGPAEAQPCAPNCWTISGSVVGPLGEAVVGADIDLLLAGTTTEILLSGDVTSADGSFTFTIEESVPTGFYDLVIRPVAGAEYFPTTLTGQFLTGSTTLPAPLTVDPAAILTGRVVDELGIGLPEVDLNFYDPVTGIESLFSGDVTDAGGFFEILVIPDVYDIEFRVTLTTPGGPYVPVFLSDRPLISSLDLGTVVFHDGEVLTGTVRNSGGSPVPNCDLDVFDPVTGEKIHTISDFTDLNGVFSVHVPDGPWQVEVDPPVATTLVAKFIDVVVLPGVPNDVGIVTLPNGVAVTGTTVDGGGTPVPEIDLDFVISATGIEIPTAHDNANSSGVFSVRVEPDSYDIQFRPPFATGLAPKVVPAIAVLLDTNLGPVTLDAGPALTGAVTDGGVPIEGVEVTLADNGTGAPVYTFGNDTDALGLYGIRQVPGTYDVTFTPPIGSTHAPYTEVGVVLSTNTVLDHDFALAVPPVTSLVCGATGADVTLTWIAGAPDYDSVEITRDGVTIAVLPGDAASHVDLGLADAAYEYSVVAVRNTVAADAALCSVTVSTGPGADEFIRGDPNDSATINLADAILTLDYLFNANNTIRCVDAIDVNDSGQVNIADAVYLLAYLFSSQAPPFAPFPDLGVDPTPDALPPCQ